MKTLTDADAIRSIYPTLSSGRDFAVGPDGSLLSWIIKDKRFIQPTPEQLAEAKTQIAANWQIIGQVQTSLRPKFAALSAGERSFYRSVMEDVAIQLLAGNLIAAREIIATAPVPSSSLQAAQAAMLSVFPATS